ncbi:DUF2637 domain-containing protein [Tersicoccus sp. MR15.9]|uniref:DUF2637 domain-containing protein n=1 Tax=Tersicoccus mangrovi TaxID=3121635 RepID=UPI002FE6AADD
MSAVRFEPDSRPVVLLSVGLVGVLAAASFTLSFLGLIQVAAWAGIPEQLRWLVPIVVDSTILVYAIAAAVQRARGESTRLSWVAVAFFTLVSVAANAAHVIAPGGDVGAITPTMLFGAGLAAIMPVSLFFATETTIQLAVAPPHGSVAARRRRARAVQEAAHPVEQVESVPEPAKKARGEVDVARIRELARQGRSQRAIAEELHVSKTSVARALTTVSS